MIRLRYFASLRETLGVTDEQLELPAGVRDVSDLSRWLHVAVNQVIASPDAAIRDGDEVAWFPPVTGG